jgi:hypothetical protein
VDVTLLLQGGRERDGVGLEADVEEYIARDEVHQIGLEKKQPRLEVARWHH